MDLIACQEELNIVIQITQQQVEMITELKDTISKMPAKAATPTKEQALTSKIPRTEREGLNDFSGRTNAHNRATFRQLSSSTLTDPVAQLLDNLQRELTDLVDLRNNTDRLVTRTIQLVNIRLEDHGKAILVFTLVTIIFLPLNFVSSFFGMNFRDIREMKQTQWLFWAVALCVTAGVVGGSVFVAFTGGKIVENFLTWRDRRRELHLSTMTVARQGPPGTMEKGFKVLGTTGQSDSSNPMAGPMR